MAMVDWFSFGKNKVEKELPAIFKQGFNGNLYHTFRDKYYNKEKNKYLPITKEELINVFKLDTGILALTKEEAADHLKETLNNIMMYYSSNCKCKIGDGNPIIISAEKPYSYKEMVEKHFPDYTLRTVNTQYNNRVQLALKGTDIKIEFSKTHYYKKACKRCETCLGKYDQMKKYIQESINIVEEKVADLKLLEELCEGDK